MLVVICGTGGKEWITERPLARSGWDETVADVAAGEWTDVSSIIHVATGVDVLPNIAWSVMDKWANGGEPLTEWQRSFVDDNCRGRKANQLLQAAE